MTIIDTLITDRSASDYAVWEQLNAMHWEDMSDAQKTAWLTGAATKGSYGAIDLNRVGEAITYLAQRLTHLGYYTVVSPKTDFEEGNNKYSMYDQIVHYLEDLRTLRAALDLPATTPALPETPDDWSLEDANNIEQILVILDDYLTRTSKAWFYSADLYSGEV